MQCYVVLCYVLLCHVMLCSVNYGRMDKEPSRLHGQDNDITWLAIYTEQKMKSSPFLSLYIYIYISLFTEMCECVMNSEY